MQILKEIFGNKRENFTVRSVTQESRPNF